MSNFAVFKQAVAKQFSLMVAYPLFQTDIDRDFIWNTYLNAFPPGTNPMYRKRTEHDCSCCRTFIRQIGGAVAIDEQLNILTVWDGKIDDPTYAAVAKAMRAYVLSRAIKTIYLHYDKHVGTDKNFEQLIAGKQQAWEHFYVNLPSGFIAPKDIIATRQGKVTSTHDVFERALREIDLDSINTVLDLIAQGSLYRGSEHKNTLEQFREHKIAFSKAKNTEAFTWLHSVTASPVVTHIRNSVIGTLLTDLSAGVDLEQAVKAFETKVAPTNYKRPTALITPAMIARAKTEIEGLGLTSALERRFARLTDITMNNMLWANHTTKTTLGGTLFDELKPTATTKRKLDKIEAVPVDRFVAEILPKAESLEVMVENQHTPNFVSLIAPLDPTAGALFKWNNAFSWSYNGEVADSIKERVKAAGGRIDGDLCCRLAWNNTDDLDFHMREVGGYRIFFQTRRQVSSNGGTLDLDANGIDGFRTDPAENIVYPDKNHMRAGTYKLTVTMFAVRNTSSDGFEVEIEVLGKKTNFVYTRPMRNGESVDIADIIVDTQRNISVVPKLDSTTTSKEVWGVKTHQFIPVSTVLLSPNYWDEQTVGNKHLFFMLEQCRNDGKARGFYNEFLKAELNDHRKVLELVGNQTRVQDDPHQLSGIGFSSTQKNNLVCQVKGSFTRTINIVF